MKWWNEKDLAWKVASLLVIVAALIAGIAIPTGVVSWNSWAPSIVCNLFTTGLTI